MSVLPQTLRFTLRTVARYPWTHGAAVLILSLSIAAVLSILSLTDEIVWQPLRGVTDPERVTWLFPTRGGEGADRNRESVSPANTLYYREHAETLEGVSWFTGARRILFDQGEPEAVTGFEVGGDFFSMLGVTPQLGRLLESRDSEPGADPAVVISEELWRRRFSGDPSLVGRWIDLSGTRHRLVGIAPRGLLAMLGGPALWLPHRLTAEQQVSRESSLVALARLKPGSTLAQANLDLARMSEALAALHPESDQGLGAEAVALPQVLARFRPLALALVLAAVFVLGVAGANTANLLLAQAEQRTRELAVRQAVGAGFGQVLWQWALQAALLVGMGVALGTLLSHWAISAVVASLPESVRRSAIHQMTLEVHPRAWLLTAAIAALATLLVGLAPARQCARLSLTAALRDGGRGAVGKAHGRWLPRLLVGVQVTLAAALTFGAFSAYLRFVSQREAPLGFDPQGLVQLHLPLDEEDDAARGQLLERLDRALLGPGRDQGRPPTLAFVTDSPLTNYYDPLVFHVDGTPKPPPAEMPWGKSLRVTPEYFAVMSIALLKGQLFDVATEAAGDQAPCVTVFSRKLATTIFPNTNAVGQRLRLDGGEPCQVLGVVGDVHDALGDSPGDLYLPLSHGAAPGGVTLMARQLDATARRALRQRVRQIAPRQVIEEQPTSEVVEAYYWGFRILVFLFSALALLGLCLAAIGTHAMLAHVAARRRRELAVRAAVGAEPAQLVRLLLLDSLPAGLVGIALGVLLVSSVVQAASGWTPDAWVYVASVLTMVLLVAGSSVLSATRASLLSPADALRR